MVWGGFQVSTVSNLHPRCIEREREKKRGLLGGYGGGWWQWWRGVVIIVVGCGVGGVKLYLCQNPLRLY